MNPPFIIKMSKLGTHTGEAYSQRKAVSKRPNSSTHTADIQHFQFKYKTREETRERHIITPLTLFEQLSISIIKINIDQKKEQHQPFLQKNFSKRNDFRHIS